MPDNREQIKKRLGNLGLDPHREEEIIRELSDHYTDHAAALEAHGTPNDAAAQEAFDSISDWAELRKKIRSAEMEEPIMNHRSRVLWLPALGAIALSSITLALLQFFGVVPHFYWLGQARYAFLTFYVPWLVALPVIGAVAALWSERAGGRPIHRVLAALAPPLGLLGFVLVSPFIGLLIYGWLRFVLWGVGHTTLPSPFPLHAPPMMGVLVVLTSWVLLPAAGLLLGATPFLRHSHPHP